MNTNFFHFNHSNKKSYRCNQIFHPTFSLKSLRKVSKNVFYCICIIALPCKILIKSFTWNTSNKKIPSTSVFVSCLQVILNIIVLGLNLKFDFKFIQSFWWLIGDYCDILNSLFTILWFVSQQIQAIQKNGPYNLIGETWSGIVTLHLTRLLEERGHKVVVFLLDAAPSLSQARASVFRRSSGMFASEEFLSCILGQQGNVSRFPMIELYKN